jgi:hypothetical protein
LDTFCKIEPNYLIFLAVVEEDMARDARAHVDTAYIVQAPKQEDARSNLHAYWDAVRLVYVRARVFVRNVHPPRKSVYRATIFHQNGGPRLEFCVSEINGTLATHFQKRCL